MTNFQVLFHTTLKFQQHYAILLLKRFHLNSYNNFWVSFRVKGQHFIRSKQYQVKVLLQRFHLNGSTIGFYPKTSKLNRALNKFLKGRCLCVNWHPQIKTTTHSLGQRVSPSHFFKQKGYHEESLILQLPQFRWVFSLDSLPALPSL